LKQHIWHSNKESSRYSLQSPVPSRSFGASTRGFSLLSGLIDHGSTLIENSYFVLFNVFPVAIASTILLS
jgi:hypothetical protein